MCIYRTGFCKHFFPGKIKMHSEMDKKHAWIPTLCWRVKPVWESLCNPQSPINKKKGLYWWSFSYIAGKTTVFFTCKGISSFIQLHRCVNVARKAYMTQNDCFHVAGSNALKNCIDHCNWTEWILYKDSYGKPLWRETNSK